MGCSSSRQDDARPPSLAPAVGTVATRGTAWNRYEELAAILYSFRSPTSEELEYISTCDLSALQPTDPTMIPLLALAKDQDEWFRCLIERCDPGVTWTQGGVQKSLRKELIGHRNHSIWCTYMKKWDERDERDERDEEGQDRETDTRALSAGENERWWSEFGPVAVTLGFTAAALGTLAMGSGAAFGFPAVAVGPVIWTVIKKWYTSFENCRPSPNLKDIFTKHANVVGSILKELNTRIETAENVVLANPENLAANDECVRQRIRVDALRTLLEEDTEKMESIVERSGFRVSDRIKYDEMMEMLRGLLDFQRKLHSELMEEQMSENLGKAVSLLESIEYLVRGPVPFSRGNQPRTQTLRLDSRAFYGAAPGGAPSGSNHGSTAGSARAQRSSRTLAASASVRHAPLALISRNGSDVSSFDEL